MRNPPLIFFLLFPLILLSACAAGPGVQDGVGQDPSPAVPTPADTGDVVVEEAPAPADLPAHAPQTGEGPLPALPLSGELLYQILEAEMALQRQHYQLGVSRYLQLAVLTRDPRFAERSAQIALFVHDDATALKAARLWAELVPGRSEAHQTMVVAAIRTGNLEEALEHMEILLLSGTDGLPEERFELMANLLSREHDVQEAFRLMERFISTRRDNAAAMYAYAHLAVRAGELAKASQAIDEALALRPGWYNAVALRIRIVLLSDGPDAAMGYLAGAVDEHPEDTNLRTAYARTLVEAGLHDEALEQYEILSGQVSPNTEILLAMGMIHLQLDRIDEAEEYLLRVREASGNGTELQFYLGWIAEKRGDIGQAIAYYASLPPEAQNHFEARVRIAILTAGEGDIASARRQLQGLRADEPAQQKRLYQVEAELLRQAGMKEDGMEVLNSALQLFPMDFDLLYSRALLAESMDRLDVLENDLRAILGQEPDHVDALNALGYTLADRTDRYGEAYEYIKRALELNPENHAILDSMGWVLYRLGNYEEAITYLRASLEIRLDHEVAAHLGEVLWVVGERDEAMAVWQRALEEFPDEEILHETMQRLTR